SLFQHCLHGLHHLNSMDDPGRLHGFHGFQTIFQFVDINLIVRCFGWIAPLRRLERSRLAFRRSSVLEKGLANFVRPVGRLRHRLQPVIPKLGKHHSEAEARFWSVEIERMRLPRKHQNTSLAIDEDVFRSDDVSSWSTRKIAPTPDGCPPSGAAKAPALRVGERYSFALCLWTAADQESTTDSAGQWASGPCSHASFLRTRAADTLIEARRSWMTSLARASAADEK